MSLLEDVFVAYYDARRNKRNTMNQLRFEFDLEKNLVELYEEIKERRYVVGRSVCFMVERPVLREVFAADFRDRVVHHLLFNYINPIFERTFIADSYACRKGKGTLYGIRRLEKHIRSCSCNYTRPCHVLKLDLQGYFMHIDRGRLHEMIMNVMQRYGRGKTEEGLYIRDTEEYQTAVYLIGCIVPYNPVEGCLRKGNRDGWRLLPHNKSLFYSPQGCGLPIGNLTSQLFSNIYLNELDRYMKRTLHVRHYGRYVDDFYVVHTDRRYLLSLLDPLKLMLSRQLGLTLHPHKIRLSDYRQGVVFTGAVLKPYRTYACRRTYGQFGVSMYRWEKCLADADRHPSRGLLETVRATLNSYLGLMRHFNSRKHAGKYIGRFAHIWEYGEMRTHAFRLSLRQSEQHIPERTEH